MHEMIWISVVKNANGITDIELLDSEPTDDFRDGLWKSLENGDIEYWEIRAGFVNGGDSSIEYASEG